MNSTTLLERPAETPQERGFEDPRIVARYQAVCRQSPRSAELFRRIYEGRASARQCIKGRCLECVGFDVTAIRECSAPACPLFNFRPFMASWAEGGGR